MPEGSGSPSRGAAHRFHEVIRRNLALIDTMIRPKRCFHFPQIQRPLGEVPPVSQGIHMVIDGLEFRQLRQIISWVIHFIEWQPKPQDGNVSATR